MKPGETDTAHTDVLQCHFLQVSINVLREFKTSEQHKLIGLDGYKYCKLKHQ